MRPHQLRFASVATVLLASCSAVLQIEGSDEKVEAEVGRTKDVVYTITNSGAHPALDLRFEPLPDGWSHGESSCGSVLESKASCSHVVTFSPVTAGEYEATLRVSYRNQKGLTSNALRTLHARAIEPSEPACYRGVKSYQGHSGVTWNMHAWEGELTVLYTREEYSEEQACEATRHMDTCFAMYQQLGQRDWPIILDPHFPGKGTLAIVPETCGAGCGAGGKAEMLESIFERDGGDLTDPYSLWVGFYEFGRQGGLPFPFYEILSNDPERMTAAFPEYVWSTCLRELGLSDVELARRGNFSPAIYRERFLGSPASYADFQDQPGNADWYGVAPGQVMAAIFYDLHVRFGEEFMGSFFANAKARQAAEPRPTNGHAAACNLLQIAESADPVRMHEVSSFLIDAWRLPTDCPGV